MSKVQGVIAILISPDGRHIVTGTCFDLISPDGFTLKAAQERSAWGDCARRVIDHFVGRPLRPAFGHYEANELLQNLINHHKWQLSLEHIGYEEGE